MKWTNKAPTREGWYWVKKKSSIVGYNYIAYIYEEDGKLMIENDTLQSFIDRNHNPPYYLIEWSNETIQEPEE